MTLPCQLDRCSHPDEYMEKRLPLQTRRGPGELKGQRV